MKIIPAIDILEGDCVRLYQGKREKKTVYSTDPIAMARMWEERGAQHLHVVDLDGAFTGKTKNKEVIESIRRAISIPIQLGGGMRDRERVEEYLQLGIDYAIIGTMALHHPEQVQLLCTRYPGRIIVGIDCRQDRIAVEGWVKNSHLSPLELARAMVDIGVSQFIITDIARDGTLIGPNMDLLQQFKALPVSLTASGGVSSLEDIEELRQIGGIQGVIIGQALYRGELTLEQIQGSRKELP